MAERTFAAWVEPVAAQLAAGRRQIVEVARSLPADAWERSSPNEGWSYRELLAHLATGDWALQAGLQKVIEGEILRVSDFADVDGTNARNIATRAALALEELIAEVESESEDTQRLLAQLAAEHETYTPEDVPVTIGDYLRQFAGHDQAHLTDLRTAFEASG